MAPLTMNNNKRRLLICDIETSGMSPEQGAVMLEVGLMLMNSVDDPNPNILVVTICPTEEQWKFASPQSLKVNGFTWERLQTEGIPMEDAKIKILEWIATNEISSETVQYVRPESKVRPALPGFLHGS